MSTKIYVAYRIRPGIKFWHVVETIKRQAKHDVKERLLAFVDELAPNVETASSEDYQLFLSHTGDEQAAREMAAASGIRKLYRSQLGNAERNPFNFDVSISAHEHRGQVHLIPFCDMTMRNVLDFMANMPELEDFAYWNNTDKPESISDEEWDQRRDTWDAIHSAGWGTRMVGITILQWDSYLYVDPEQTVRTRHADRIRQMRESASGSA